MDMEEIATKISNHETRLENLEGYQEKQNGTINEVDSKVDSLRNYVRGQFDKIRERIDGMFYWLLAFLITVIGGMGTIVYFLWQILINGGA